MQRSKTNGQIGGILSAFFFVFMPVLIVGQHRMVDEKTTIDLPDPISKRSLAKLSGENILHDIIVLASDSMEGRATGSAGYARAASFVRDRYIQYGLLPFGDSYYQQFKLAWSDVKSTVHLSESHADSVETMNVMAFKKGSSLTDEVVVLTAHLDHLGRSGDTIFHGANDNASGVAVLLAVAQALQSIETKRTILFVAFSGEEVGLKGSEFFVGHAPIPLNRIRWALNLDLVGSGRDGLMVQGVDGHDRQWERVKQINEKYFHFELKTRPNSPNSDQYFLHRSGVPAFFIYAYNGTSPYHHPDDLPSRLDKTVLENLAKFVFIACLQFANQ